MYRQSERDEWHMTDINNSLTHTHIYIYQSKIKWMVAVYNRLWDMNNSCILKARDEWDSYMPEREDEW